MEIIYFPHFHRSFKHLTKDIQDKATECVELFKQNIHNPSLHFHKLHGNKREYWAIDVTPSIRILLIFKGDNRAMLYDIGNHDDMYEK